jgi:hypothetical protein
MKVKDLIAILSGFNENAELIIQKDSEGNGYSPLAGADHDAVYVPATTWDGAVFDTKWSADDACMEESEWKKLMKRKRCVVLFPVN